MTAFFVPNVESDATEEAFSRLAALCQRSVPSMLDRVHQIRFVHDGEEWTATVGERLRGERIRSRGGARGRHGRSAAVTDPATVLAIFPGEPYLVVTDSGAGRGSRWANPFMAGVPAAVQTFG